MGISLGDLFGEGIKNVKNTLGQVASTGASTALAGIEQYAADQMQDMANQTKDTAQQKTQDLMKSDPGKDATGILKYIQDGFKNTLSSVGLQNYGGTILLGAGALIVVGVFLSSRE